MNTLTQRRQVKQLTCLKCSRVFWGHIIDTICRDCKLLTPREKNILARINQFGGLVSYWQIKELYFLFDHLGNEIKSSRQICYRKLKKLINYNYVRPVDLDKFNGYVLGPDGIRFVEKYLGPARIKKSADIPRNVKHFVGINDFRTKLILDCKSKSDIVNLGIFYPEYYKRHDLTDQAAGITHCPDAAFVLESANKVNRRLFFFEMDCNTEDLGERGKFVQMIRFYLEYLSSGIFRMQKYQGFNLFRLLIVTTGNGTRVYNIRNKVIQRIEQEYYNLFDDRLIKKDSLLRLFLVANAAILNKDNILGNLWRSLDPADESWYSLIT